MSFELEYLGHIISGEGIRVDPRKINAVVDWEAPKNIKQAQSFLGLCNYYRKFVEGFAKIATPLSNLTRKKIPFQWKEEQENAFNNS